MKKHEKTCPPLTDSDLLNTVLQLIAEHGTNGLAEGIRLLVNEAIHILAK